MNRSTSMSVVLPVFNEQANIVPVYEALTSQLSTLGRSYEIIFVNDGSRDNSLAILARLAEDDDHVRVVSLSRNFGHQSAITAGMEYATGDAVIVMDADLQHPPSLIPAMVERWSEGYQVVYTIREDDENTGFVKRFTSTAFYQFINRISDTTIVSGAADFRLMDRSVVNCLSAMPERSRFLRGMVSWVGFQQIGIRYKPARRHSGKSKYSWRRMLSLAVHGITSFSALPLRLAAYIGFITAMAVVPYAFWALYARVFTDTAVPGWTSLLIAVIFLGSVQLISIGVIGEYVGRIYTEVKGRPLYIAEHLLGFKKPEGIPRTADSAEARRSEPSKRLMVTPK